MDKVPGPGLPAAGKAPESSACAHKLVAQLLADQRRRWQQGDRVEVEEYLECHEVLHSDTEGVLDLIYNEIVLREEACGAPSLQEYARRFPQFASQLKHQLEVHRVLEASQVFTSPLAHDQRDACGEDIPELTVADWPKVTGYEIVRELGHGGMGVVYEARQSSPQRVVALKMIRGVSAGTRELGRFRGEADAVARLQHPNIVQIYEVGEQHGRPYFSLELVSGGSLAQSLKTGPRSPRAAAQLVETLARAMHAAHQHAVVHRDLKPANILLTAEGVPKITDFGLAKQLDLDLGQTQTGAVMGTPSYMAPEQAAGKKEIGPAADVYALGAILYEMLTGRPPFLAESWEATRQLVLSAEPVSPRRLQPKLPHDLETVSLKCLEKDPRRRYPTAQALAEELQLYLDGRPIRSRTVGHVERGWRWARRNPKLALASGIAALGLLAAAAISIAFLIYQARDLRNAQIGMANLAFDKGVDLCHKGEASEGMLWLAHSLELAPTDARELRWLIGGNLAGWYQEVWPLHAILSQDSPVQAAVFCPGGETVLIASGSFAQRWELATGKRLGEPFLHKDEVLAIAVSPDGKCVLTGCMDTFARLWDVASSKLMVPPLPHGGYVTGVAFSPDGKTVLTASWDKTVCRWETATGKRIWKSPSHPRPLGAVTISPDGNTVLTACHDGKARFWDVATGKPKGEPPLPHNQHVPVYGPKGKTVLTASGNIAYLWDLKTVPAQRVHSFKHEDEIRSLAISPDGQTILTGSEDRTARLWDASSGRPLALFRHDDAVQSVSFSAPDGQSVLTGGRDGTVRLWERPAGNTSAFPLSDQRFVWRVAFSPDGKKALTGSWDKTAQLWEVASRKPLGAPLGHEDPVVAMAFSTDGDMIVTGTKHEAWLWDIRSGEPVVRAWLNGSARVLEFSHDSTMIVRGGDDNTAQLWVSATGLPLGQPLHHDGQVFAAAFSPDDKTVLTASNDRFARLWDTATGILLKTFAHDRSVCAVAFSPDGKYVLTGTEGSARMWDARTGEGLNPPLPHHGLVFAALFSPSGRTLLTASSDHTARLWERTTRAPFGKIMKHHDLVRSAAFSPDGRLIVTGSDDHTARFWDATTGNPFGPPLQHPGRVSQVTFSPDGKHILTACEQSAWFWTIPDLLGEPRKDPVLWAQVITGMELDEAKEPHVLQAPEWERRRQMLHEGNGPAIH